MSDTEPREIVIVRRRGGSEDDGHHGGAWKIAFADFMTAMMAFFLVLWIVNSTSKETKTIVAQYFNPVKLAETSAAKKGLQDAKEAEAEPSPKSKADKPGEPPPPRGESKDSKEKAPESKGPSPSPVGGQDRASAGDAVTQSGVAKTANASPTAISELSAIEDPMSVLDEIAGRLEGTDSFERAQGVTAKSAQSALEDRLNFRDPFEPISPTAAPRRDVRNEGLRGSISQRMSKDEAAAPPPGAADAIPPVPPAANAAPGTVQQAAKLRQALNAELKQDPPGKDMPKIEVTADPEGILISLTDSANFSMFTSASSVPATSTVKLLAQLAKKLRETKGNIVVRGHTDSRPFRAGASDNWRLSSSRAQMAFYMLVRGGLDEKRIERVEGYADRHPRNVKNPAAPENRRIDILIRPEQKP